MTAASSGAVAPAPKEGTHEPHPTPSCQPPDHKHCRESQQHRVEVSNRPGRGPGEEPCTQTPAASSEEDPAGSGARTVPSQRPHPGLQAPLLPPSHDEESTAPRQSRNAAAVIATLIPSVGRNPNTLL